LGRIISVVISRWLPRVSVKSRVRILSLVYLLFVVSIVSARCPLYTRATFVINCSTNVGSVLRWFRLIISV